MAAESVSSVTPLHRYSITLSRTISWGAEAETGSPSLRQEPQRSRIMSSVGTPPVPRGAGSLILGNVVRDIRGMRLTCPGVTLTLTGPGGCADTTTTRVLGVYEFAMLGDGTYTVTPSKAGCTFTPSS